jgi:hypothetical protein
LADRFERFFRHAADLDIDKEDLRRYSDFVHRKTYDLLLEGRHPRSWQEP